MHEGNLNDNDPKPIVSVNLDHSLNNKPVDHNLSKKSLSWTSSEYILNKKSASWFALYCLIIVVLAIGIYLWIGDLFSSIIILIVGGVFIFFAGRSPRTLTYELDSYGLHVGTRFYPYDNFKSFSVIDEGPNSYVVFSPLKRFSPPLSVYYDSNNEEEVLTVISNFLPHEEAKIDPVDQLMRKIRF